MEREDPLTSSSESDLANDSDCESLDGLEFDTDDDLSGYIEEQKRPACDDLGAIKDFISSFDDRYPSPGLIFSIEPLDEALRQSLFNPEDPRPLALFLYHQKSVAANIFCKMVLSSEVIVDYLNQKFIVWPWDRTSDINCRRLLSLLNEHVGFQVTQKLASLSVDAYPLLMCLSFEKGQIKIINVIKGIMSRDETYHHLVEAREEYNRRIELPDISDENVLLPNDLVNENSLVSKGVLIPVARHSDTFYQIANDLAIDDGRIIRIHQVENKLRLPEYLSQKETIIARLGNDQAERRLFHGCPREAAESIVERGFDHGLIGMHGTVFGHGFYFSSSQVTSHCYATPDRLNNDECSLLVCRVIVGKSCIGNSTMRTCPIGYDSTTDGRNIYVVYSNQQILPEFLVTYR